MTRKTKVEVINSELRNRCQAEDSPNIRELLDILLNNSMISYHKTREDHRYHQGYLQAIDDIVGKVTKT